MKLTPEQITAASNKYHIVEINKQVEQFGKINIDDINSDQPTVDELETDYGNATTHYEVYYEFTLVFTAGSIDEIRQYLIEHL